MQHENHCIHRCLDVLCQQRHCSGHIRCGKILYPKPEYTVKSLSCRAKACVSGNLKSRLVQGHNRKSLRRRLRRCNINIPAIIVRLFRLRHLDINIPAAAIRLREFRFLMRSSGCRYNDIWIYLIHKITPNKDFCK